MIESAAFDCCRFLFFAKKRPEKRDFSKKLKKVSKTPCFGTEVERYWDDSSVYYIQRYISMKAHHGIFFFPRIHGEFSFVIFFKAVVEKGENSPKRERNWN